MLFFGKKKLLGVDIGTSSVKLAELDVGRKSSMVSFGMAPTPPNSFSGGDILDTQAVGRVIGEVYRQIKSSRNLVATGMGGSSVIVKKISIPKVEDSLIAEQLRWEAEQYIPYDVNEVNLGYEVLDGSKTASQSENIDLLLIAAVQAHVYKYAETLQVAGLNCELIDVNGFALANCFKMNYGDMPGETVVLLNIGASATNMVVLENTNLVFARDIPVGGMTYTLDLQKSLNVSFEEAESIKLGYSNGQETPEEATSVIQSTHVVIMDEIKASYDFFLNTGSSPKISRTFVTGGGSKMKGLLDEIAKLSPMDKLNPFHSVSYNQKVFSSSYIEQIRDFSSVAIGLGLRKPGDA